MKKNLFLILGFIIIVTISSCAGDSGTTVPVDGAATTDSDTTDQSDDTNPGEEIKFASPALEECVKNAMISEGIIETGGKITPENAKELKKLECYEKGAALTDISGIKYFTGIEILFLYNNEITDINDIKYLKNLKEINLSRNNILDFDPLKELYGIEVFKIGGKPEKIISLSNLGFLCKIKSITYLSIYYMNLSDISCISESTGIETVAIENSKINDFSPISSLNKINILFLSNNAITDLSFIKDLANLKTIGASNNAISDISFMSNLVNLENIYISNNMIRDVSAIRNLKLKDADFTYNCIEDTSPISEALGEEYGTNTQMTEKCNQF